MGKRQRAVVYMVLWMILIFAFSSFQGDESALQSGRIVRFVLGIVRMFFGEGAVQVLVDAGIEFYIRKTAHFTEYAVLAFLTARAMRLNGFRYWAVAAPLFSALYASTDEFHQSFVPGRGMELRDVGIDSCGAISGVLLYLMALMVLKRVRRA